MTRMMVKGLVVAALHVGLAASLGGKLLIDRANYPRAWARTAPFDPDLPIRGRYVRLAVEAEIGAGLNFAIPTNGSAPARARSTVSQRVTLTATDGRLVALPNGTNEGLFAAEVSREGEHVARLMTPVAYFIPEHVADPSIRAAGEELWVEVTIPPKGGLRPIRLGVKKDGVITPLDLD